MVWLQAIGLIALIFAVFILSYGIIRFILSICEFVARCKYYHERIDQIEERLRKCHKLK